MVGLQSITLGKNNTSKIAILYDSFHGTVGGEPKVLLQLAKGLRADVITTVFSRELYPNFNDVCVHSFIEEGQKMSFLKNIITFLHLDLSNYDVVITGGRLPMLISIKKERPYQIHYEQPPAISTSILYRIHEADRYKFSSLLRLPLKVIVKHIDLFVANSLYLKERILKYYGVNAKVIYPPVDIEKFRYKSCGDYFLSVQRFTPAKRVEIQLEAFKKLQNERLIVAGALVDCNYLRKLQKVAPKNVEFILNPSDSELIELYANCKATIQTSMEEPFGLVPIESMAAGKPCIAVNEGGFKETIVHGKTGILINKPYVNNLVNVIKNFDKYNFNPKLLRKRAEYFSLEKFIINFKQLIKKVSKF